MSMSKRVWISENAQELTIKIMYTVSGHFYVVTMNRKKLNRIGSKWARTESDS